MGAIDTVLQDMLGTEAEARQERDEKVPRWARATKANAARAAAGEAIKAFAKLNGWRPSSCLSRNPGNLGRVTAVSDWADENNHDNWDLLDHVLWFRKGRQYVAVVGQPYDWRADDFEEERARLRARGFVLHIPPDPLASIHYPGGTLFLVVTKPGVEVNFLPEQDGRLAARWVREDVRA